MKFIPTINETNFESKTLEIFQYQAKNNACYSAYLDYLEIQPEAITKIHSIPFLPIRFFKNKKVVTGNFESVIQFKSSGTTGSIRSTHHLKTLETYIQSMTLAFEHFYGPILDYQLLAYLPSYHENPESSLLFMIDHFISLSQQNGSQYLPKDLDLATQLINAQKKKGKTLLMGVSYALLDLVEYSSFNLTNTVVMETGGMKGRRKELTRKELHQQLKEGFSVDSIHSEYGMTELLSQAYSKGDGRFACPPWMRVFSRPINDPFGLSADASTGLLKVVDLANVDSCCFIETEDLCKVYGDGSFEVLGRLDNSDLRGCNLLVE